SEQGELASHVRPGESAAGEGEYAGATGRRPLLSQGRFYLILRYRPVRGARKFVVGKNRLERSLNRTPRCRSKPARGAASWRAGADCRAGGGPAAGPPGSPAGPWWDG